MPNPAVGMIANLAISAYAAKKQGDAADAQKDVADKQNQIAMAQWNNYLERFDPVAGLLAYDIAGITPGEYNEAGEFVPDERAMQDIERYKAEQKLRTDEAVGMAASDVEQSARAGQETRAREMQRYGLNPASGRYRGEMRRTGNEIALAKAGAMTGARRDAKRMQRAEMQDFLASGKGIPGTALQGLRGAEGAYGALSNTYGKATAGGLQAAGYFGQQYFNQQSAPTTSYAPAASSGSYGLGSSAAGQSLTTSSAGSSMQSPSGFWNM